ncbi:MAG: ABC-2 transporter permease [Propionibacteriaceae bacterium]|nr:ABC-2 transporter permease [Propionibacteriaceae bacterium]
MRDLWPMLRIDLRILPFVAVAATVLVATWAILGQWTEAFSIVPAMSTMGVIMALLLVQFDGHDGRGLLYATLPVRRRVVMISHYLVGLLVLVGSGALLVLARLILGAIGRDMGAQINLRELLGGGGSALLAMAVVIPIIVRFGSRRAGIYLIFGVAFVFGAVGGLAAGFGQPSAPAWLGDFGHYLVAGTGLALYAVSFLVALRCYERRDF